MTNKRRRHHRRGMGSLKIAVIVLCALLFIALVAGASAWYLWRHSSVLNEEKMFVPEQKTDIGEPTQEPAALQTPKPEQDSPKAPAQYDLYSDGKYYALRPHVVSVLFMGVDSKKNEATDSTIVTTGNQADTLLLGVFDTEAETVRVLHVPRDTEADVKVLDMAMQYVDTEKKHICLQHAYGDGGALSCELQTEAVSNLLFGVPIIRYVSLGTNGIVKAVNAIGGVELTMLDDFSFYSSKMQKGATVKLNGQRALVYIQSRQSMREDQTDQNRMKRQVQFMKAFVSAVKAKSKDNPMLVLSVYEAIQEYMQTNLTLEELLFLANQGIRNELTDENLIHLPGEVGDEYQPMFHMDEDAAHAIAIDLFYQEILPNV